MTEHCWPLSRLRIRTPSLELRLPAVDDLYALAALAADGVHDPGVQPFADAWTDVPPADRARSVLQYNWTTWGQWKPSDWKLELVVVRAGTIVGSQGLSARDFAVRRELGTGSWLGQKYQGQGIGTEMRAAALHLAFEGLHADYAISTAFDDNPASRSVSSKLGYADDGISLYVVRDQRALMHRFRMDRPAWEAHRTVPVHIEGLADCLPDFGLPPAGQP